MHDAPVTPEARAELREKIVAILRRHYNTHDTGDRSTADDILALPQLAALLRAPDAAPDRRPKAVRTAALEEAAMACEAVSAETTKRGQERSADSGKPFRGTIAEVYEAEALTADDCAAAIRALAIQSIAPLGRKAFGNWCSQQPEYHDKLWADMAQDVRDFWARQENLAHPDTPPAPEADLRPKHRKPWRSLDDLMGTAPDVVAAYFIPGDPPDVIDAIRRTWGPEKPRPPMQLQLEDLLRRMVAQLPAQQSRQDEPGTERYTEHGVYTPPDTAGEAIKRMADDGDADPIGTAHMNYPYLFSADQVAMWLPPAASDRASGVTAEAVDAAVDAWSDYPDWRNMQLGAVLRKLMCAALEAAQPHMTPELPARAVHGLLPGSRTPEGGVAAPSISGAPASRQEAEAVLDAYENARIAYHECDDSVRLIALKQGRASLLDMMVGGSASREVERLRTALTMIVERNQDREWTGSDSSDGYGSTGWIVRDGQYAKIARSALATPGADAGGQDA